MMVRGGGGGGDCGGGSGCGNGQQWRLLVRLLFLGTRVKMHVHSGRGAPGKSCHVSSSSVLGALYLIKLFVSCTYRKKAHG